jgi:hypothetical protein
LLVSQHCGDETDRAQQLFRQSLHAALTLEEIQKMCGGLGIQPQHVQMSSDRHWTIDWTKPIDNATVEHDVNSSQNV